MRKTVNKDGFTPTPICITSASVKEVCTASLSAVSLSGRCANRCEGFTLTEVIMAALLLTIAIVPILKGLTQTNLNSVIIQRRTQSLCLAQEKLNRIKAAALYNFENDLTETGIELSTSYLCNVSQTVVNTNLKAISISVGYDQDNDRSLSPDEVEVTLQTQIAKRW